MSPRKQPQSLFKMALRSSLKFINQRCYEIERQYSDIDLKKCRARLNSLKAFIMTMLPARLFDSLCRERRHLRYRGDPRVQLHVLIHPRMTVFRRAESDTAISQNFWLKTLPGFSRVVVLDLKFLCTDEMLEVISSTCHQLQELNMISRIDVCKSVVNASVLLRNVSDVGLCCVSNLKKLRVLTMDPPRNEKCSRVGRCITQGGVLLLLRELKNLEELNIEACDLGTTLIGAMLRIGPLSLKKVSCQFASADGIRRLINLCPRLEELSVTRLSPNDRETILEEITNSNLRLNTLNMSLFSYSESLKTLLEVQGQYLTHFSLWDIEHSVTAASVVTIGTCCPNLICLCLMTQSNDLIVPVTRRRRMFTEIESLTLGNEIFDLERVLIFFLSSSNHITNLVLKYQKKAAFTDILISLIGRGYLMNISRLWLDSNLEVSKDALITLIEACEHLTSLTANFGDSLADILSHISSNNLDLRLGGY